MGKQRKAESTADGGDDSNMKRHKGDDQQHSDDHPDIPEQKDRQI